MDMEADFSELRSLSTDISDAPEEARPFLRKAFQVTAHKMRDDWRAGAKRSGLEQYAADITYETSEKPSGIDAIVGPTIGDSGSFGFVEEGGDDVRSAPQHAARDALEANEPDFVEGIEIALADGLRAALGRG